SLAAIKEKLGIIMCHDPQLLLDRCFGLCRQRQAAAAQAGLPQAAPSHVLSVHDRAFQPASLQVWSVQDLAVHDLADQSVPVHERASQEPAPDQVSVVHATSRHVPPLQGVGVAAQAAPSHGCPKMSCSPLRTSVPLVTWAVPRAPSSVPVPVAPVAGCPDADADGSAAPIALLTSGTPRPAKRGLT